MIELIQGDCLVEMSKIPDKSIDMILCDLPYGTTQCKWDVVIPFDKLWAHYNRVIKPNAAIVLFGTEPFSSHLRLSNLKAYKYDWVWDKVNKFGGHLNAKKQPLRIAEYISVFYKSQSGYYPQMTIGNPYKAISKGGKTKNYGKQRDGVVTINNGKYYPKNIIPINGDERGTHGRIHPTQKPVALLEYLIKTYTLEGEKVLDNCMGSGSTGVACKNLNRKFIGIEKDDRFFNIAKSRIEEQQTRRNT